MKALVVDKFGKNSRIILAHGIPRPQVGKKDILVKVHSCALNPIDYKIKSGLFRPITLINRHKILGSDFCGEIVALGTGVKGFNIGDLTYGMINPVETGSCAEYILAKPSQISLKPRRIPSDLAAAIPLACLTAYQALVHIAKIQHFRAPRVMINGGSGGVGHFAIQIATHFGATVTAVCSERNKEFVESLGADDVIDYTKGPIFPTQKPFDIVFDVQGNLDYTEIKPFLREKSCYINTAPDPLTLVKALPAVVRAYMQSKKASFILTRPSPHDLEKIAELFDQSQLSVHVESQYSMEEAEAAFARLESSRVRGKIIIQLP